MRVTAYRGGLNFRSSAAIEPNNVLGQVFFLQTVAAKESATNGFVPCTATIDGKEVEGFALAKYLTALKTPQREALLEQAHTEHERFKRGLGLEHVKPFSGYVGEMWKAIKINLDGTDRDQPWSAAALSFMVRNAGNAYKGFRFASSHSKFVHAAIRARLKKDDKAPFWGMQLHEAKPQPGDIVVRDNPEFAPNVDYEYAAGSDSYRSHSDVIVHIDSANQKAIAIGGNLGHSVAIAEYDLAAGDFLAPTKHTFALLVNRADDVVP